MENATKALLIAGAVLVTVLIISLGIVVYNLASSTMGKVNLSETEIATFNGKFDQYEGTNVSGSKVNALIRAVLTNNLTQEDDGKKVAITGVGALATTATSLPTTMADTGKTYTVTFTYSKLGLVNSIAVTENT